MWRLRIDDTFSGSKLWFSDAGAVSDVRGGPTQSHRLIVENLGFIDITDVSPGVLDLNNEISTYNTRLMVIDLYISLIDNGLFQFRTSDHAWGQGRLKSLPTVSEADAKLMNNMMALGYIPYRNIPYEPGKANEEIKALGQRFFPFSPHSFELAMAVYEWTTPSFTRTLLMSLFTYTGIQSNGDVIDLDSIAQEIWNSSWQPFVPSNPDFMNSFMMKPALSLSQIRTQLLTVHPMLQQIASSHNRLLSAAVASMPRTSVSLIPRLFSGQLDSSLDLDRFAIELLECPLNFGPPGVNLKMDFSLAASTFLQKGKVITTKVAWSFGDCLDIATRYENGLILIASPPDHSHVWEASAYITALSDDPAKVEYVFPPGTSFMVESLEPGKIGNKTVHYLSLKPHIPSPEMVYGNVEYPKYSATSPHAGIYASSSCPPTCSCDLGTRASECPLFGETGTTIEA